MNSLLLYLLESSVLLAVLYGLYLLLLRKETFFSFNRFFLIAILVFSVLFPLLNFDVSGPGSGTINEQISELGKARNSYYTTVENWSDQGAVSSANRPWWQFWVEDWNTANVIMASAVCVYVLGLFFLLLRHTSVYLKIYRLKKQLSFTNLSGLSVAKIPSHMAPFSFLNTVFMPDHIEDKSEFDQILAHEKTHIRQRHSIDLIFVQLAAAFFWFNPVVWLLIKSLKQTHEYIADKNMLRQGFSLVEYQSLLLRQLISNNSYGLVHNFNLSFIKKRITMMSIRESGWAGKLKAVVALSITLMMGMMTAQSNTISDLPTLESTDSSSADKREIKFYVDGLLINEGLRFSDLKRYKGVFKFELDNDKEDYIHLAVELIRKGEKIGLVNKKLKEGASFEIMALLSKAQLEDYLAIDIIDGPADAVKLYNFPLFRGSDNWKKNQVSDLPPPPVMLSVNGSSVSPEKAVSLSELKVRGSNAELEYVLSEFVDLKVLSSQAGDVTATLMRKGKAVKAVVSKGVQREATIPLKGLLEAAKKGDSIMVQFGDPNGLRFGSEFLLQ